MANNQTTIWMNLTTTSKWARPPVGIVRVEQELHAGLKSLYSNAQFKSCVWNGQEFVEWKFSTPENSKIDSIDIVLNNEALVAGSLAPSYIVPLLDIPQLLLAIAQVGLTLTPRSVRPWVNRFLLSARPKIERMLNKRALRLAKKTVYQVEKSIPIQAVKSSKPAPIFNKNDILISVGLDWNESLYQSFYSLKQDYGVKVVACCYDLIPVLYPQYCVGAVAKQFSSYFIDVVEGAELVLCISRQTERDLKKFVSETGANEVETCYFPLGDNIPLANGEVSSDIEELILNDFILFVSSIERRKNHEILYKAYHILALEGKLGVMPKLIFVGMPGWGISDLLADIRLDPMTTDHIIMLNNVSDADLNKLYRKAKFCVYPSYYEGWGLPVGEALSMGKVVVASNQGSIPEVGGDLVVYADPWNPREWAKELYELATDEVRLQTLEHNIKNSYKKRTWRESCIMVKNKLDLIQSR